MDGPHTAVTKGFVLTLFCHSRHPLNRLRKKSCTKSAIERYFRAASAFRNAGLCTKSASEGQNRAAPASGTSRIFLLPDHPLLCRHLLDLFWEGGVPAVPEEGIVSSVILPSGHASSPGLSESPRGLADRFRDTPRQDNHRRTAVFLPGKPPQPCPPEGTAKTSP